MMTKKGIQQLCEFIEFTLLWDVGVIMIRTTVVIDFFLQLPVDYANMNEHSFFVAENL
jgi:hypothetical protein